MRLPEITLLALIAGALAVSACGRRADLEAPSAALVEEEQRLDGPFAVPLGRETDSAARTAVTEADDGTLETQRRPSIERDERPNRPFFLDGLVE